MALSRIVGLPEGEVPVELPDGALTDFTTSKNYVSGTVAVWLNGVRLQSDLETGFDEIPSNTVRFKEAPQSGDTVTLQYEST